jgi:hypothetical protein
VGIDGTATTGQNTPKFETINTFEMINFNSLFFGLVECWEGVWGYKKVSGGVLDAF